jgi:hypothetical protein
MQQPLLELARVLVRLDHVAKPHRDDGKRFVVRSDEVDCVCRTGIGDPSPAKSTARLG